MKKTLLLLFSIFLLIAFTQTCTDPYSIESNDLPEDLVLKSAQKDKKSYIVVLNDDEITAEVTKLKGYEKKQLAMKSATSKILKRAGISDGEIGHVYGTALKGFSIKIPPGQLKKLENDPSVKYIEEDQVATMIKPILKVSDVSSQGIDSRLWGIIRVNGGVSYEGNNRAWILDSGIDLDHPDLNVDGSSGKNFIRINKSPDDDNGHGSHVAGTVGAINNGIGVVGVAAGAPVVPVKVLDRRGSGAYSVVIAGVNYVAANGKSGDVANMSLSGPGSSSLDNAVIAASKDVKFILAAGNDYGDNAGNYSPARVNGGNIYTVSAMGENDNWASFSNIGNPPIDYCAPGVDILSTYKGGRYAWSDGTSMAAPHVAGIMLLGNYTTDGNVKDDPDGNDDPIIVHNGTSEPSENQPPVANAGPDQSLTISDPNETIEVSLDGSGSQDDGGIDSYSWTLGGEIVATGQEPSITLGEGEHIVTLTVADNPGLEDTDDVAISITVQSTSSINLTVRGYKVRGVRHVDLIWSGNAKPVDIFQNGQLIESGNNDGSFTDNLGRASGEFIYQVCESESVCSNSASVYF